MRYEVIIPFCLSTERGFHDSVKEDRENEELESFFGKSLGASKVIMIAMYFVYKGYKAIPSSSIVIISDFENGPKPTVNAAMVNS